MEELKESEKYLKTYYWAASQLGGLCKPETQIFSIIYSFDENGRECFCSYEDFAKKMHCGRATVARAIKRLTEKQIIYIGISNYRNSNTYLINYELVDQWKKLYDSK